MVAFALTAASAALVATSVARVPSSLAVGFRSAARFRPLAISMRGGAKTEEEYPNLHKPDNDPRIWLEEVEGEEALEWAMGRNEAALEAIGQPESRDTYRRLLDIMDSKEKIPFIGRVLNGLYYNFWQDETHVKGIWRRCTLDEYRKAAPAWETVLDLDALGAEDGVSWVWGGSTLLNEGPGVRKDRVMIKLSRGGSDATIAREFDLDAKAFVPPSAGGFEVPECKSNFCYKDRDTLLIGGAFGEGEMTDSGYPRTAYEWKRGTPLAEATKVWEGAQEDVSVGQYAYLDRGTRYETRYRSLTFYTSRYEMRSSPAASSGDGGEFAHVQVPEDAGVGTFADQLLVTLRSPWLGHPAGAMLTAPFGAFMAAESDAARGALLTALFTPSETASLEGTSETRNYLILSVLDNVVNEVRFFRFNAGGGGGGGGSFTLERTFQGEMGLSPSVSGVDAEESDAVWVTSSGYLQPTTLSLSDAAAPDDQEELKSLPGFFDASGLVTQQHFATSADGTRIPYFLVAPSGMQLDGSTPTILYGYGGFEISLTPGYSGGIGAAWLEKGYAYVQANIRGGGEYGPRWHQAALKEKRHKAYEDFEAVAADLIARGVTSPAKLGCQGGSNGGLLTGNMLTRASAGASLFGAIVCQVPLLDMRRFHTLLAGASWMGEYGNPERPEEWAYLQRYSPYHNVAAGASYPPILFTTSTRDDRVHPGHARKTVKKLLDLGHDVQYYENVEGGHGGAADNKQRAFMSTLAYEYFEQKLNGGARAEEPTAGSGGVSDGEYAPAKDIY